MGPNEACKGFNGHFTQIDGMVFNGIISAPYVQENPLQKTKVSPTCGTRLSENATACLVCGTELTAKAAVKSKKAEDTIQASRMQEITLSLRRRSARCGHSPYRCSCGVFPACKQASVGTQRANDRSHAIGNRNYYTHWD